jgi:iron-sulfur cluster repair protein YtfE (RIC family)
LPEHDFASHEHDEVRRGLDRIHEAGSLAGTTDEICVAALDVLHWLDAVLDPHARWEDAFLYPEIDERAGTPWATKLMSFEHQQVRDAAVALATARTTLRQAATPAALIELRARLFALEAILRAHIAREERFLIPLLESGDTHGVMSPPPRPEPATAI